MAESLLIVDGSLRISASGSLINTAGGAPCCCDRCGGCPDCAFFCEPANLCGLNLEGSGIVYDVDLVVRVGGSDYPIRGSGFQLTPASPFLFASFQFGPQNQSIVNFYVHHETIGYPYLDCSGAFRSLSPGGWTVYANVIVPGIQPSFWFYLALTRAGPKHGGGSQFGVSPPSICEVDLVPDGTCGECQTGLAATNGDFANTPATIRVIVNQIKARWCALAATSSCGDELGACCEDATGVCIETSCRSCRMQRGRTFHRGERCSTGLCPIPVRACCILGQPCFEATHAACSKAGGTWSPTLHCVSNPCGIILGQGGCCFPGGLCQIHTAASCATAGGNFKGVGTDCSGTDPCTGACCWFPPGFPPQCDDGHTPFTCSIIGFPSYFNGYGSHCANVTCQQPGPIQIATGAETLALAGGCGDCGAKDIKPWA